MDAAGRGPGHHADPRRRPTRAWASFLLYQLDPFELARPTNTALDVLARSGEHASRASSRRIAAFNVSMLLTTAGVSAELSKSNGPTCRTSCGFLTEWVSGSSTSRGVELGRRAGDRRAQPRGARRDPLGGDAGVRLLGLVDVLDLDVARRLVRLVAGLGEHEGVLLLPPVGHGRAELAHPCPLLVGGPGERGPLGRRPAVARGTRAGASSTGSKSLKSTLTFSVTAALPVAGAGPTGRSAGRSAARSG